VLYLPLFPLASDPVQRVVLGLPSTKNGVRLGSFSVIFVILGVFALIFTIS